MPTSQCHFFVRRINYFKHTTLTFTWVKLYKRPGLNSEPTHLLTFLNNGKAFPSLDGMACSSSALNSFYQSTGNPKGIGFLVLAIFQKVYIGGTLAKLGFRMGIGNLGGGNFFQVRPENSLHKK